MDQTTEHHSTIFQNIVTSLYKMSGEIDDNESFESHRYQFIPFNQSFSYSDKNGK